VPGALEAIARLNHAGWHTVIASNQSGLARGLFDMAALNAIHARMNRELAEVGGRIDAVFFCPHGPDDGCRCRKPLPGMFETIADRYGIDLAEAHLVGDSLRDLQAGAAVGCKPHFVQTGKAARLDAPSSPRCRAPCRRPRSMPTSPPSCRSCCTTSGRARRCRRAGLGVRGALMASPSPPSARRCTSSSSSSPSCPGRRWR
jgi:histidinol-phosphate phosphatase family protein